jgi:hypothetical protein
MGRSRGIAVLLMFSFWMMFWWCFGNRHVILGSDPRVGHRAALLDEEKATDL